VITLSSVIERFGADYLASHQPLPSQRQALDSLERCRTRLAATFTAQCSNEQCAALRVVPHSCGHRHCPHCQHFESQRWIERQRSQLVAGPYFLVTFTLPAELRPLAWAHQRVVYAALMDCAWLTLREFALNHRQLRGCPGAVAVLHTHSRSLEFHPHVHLAMPAAALDAHKRLWRQLQREQGYLFNHKALAKVFRGKLLDALKAQGLQPHRGVIQERDIVRCGDDGVTYQWRDSKSGLMRQCTVSGTEFLRRVLQHVLPKGFRRARSYGFLHPNAKRMAALLRLLVFVTPAPQPETATSVERPTMRCCCCGAPMRVILRRVPAQRAGAPPSARGDAGALA
jgi:hypothetical protein